MKVVTFRSVAVVCLLLGRATSFQPLPQALPRATVQRFGKGFEVTDWARDADGEFQNEAARKYEQRAMASAEANAAAGSPQQKPVELFVKAGPEPGELGDCPFAQYVRMALELKGVDYTTTPLTKDAKPAWLLAEPYEGRLPCLAHDGEAHVESDEIVRYVNFFFPEPPLTEPTDAGRAATARLFPATARFLKNTNPANRAELEEDLVAQLRTLDEHLAAEGTPFLGGDAPGVLDCSVAPKLFHLRVAGGHFEQFAVPGELGALAAYMDRVFATDAFTKTACPDEVVTWGWGNARA